MIAAATLIDRPLPYSREAELGCLGSVLLLPAIIDDVSLAVAAGDFFMPACRRLFETMLALRNEGQPIDVTVIAERLKASGDFDAIGGTAFIAEVVESVPTAHNAAHYAGIVRERAASREVILAATEVLRDAYSGDDPAGLASRAEQRLRNANDGRGSMAVTLSQAMAETAEALNDRIINGVPSGLATGLYDVDQRLGGLRAGEFIVIAGRPSMGKTSYALNIIEHVAASQGAGVLFASLEMSRRELCERLLSARTGINGEQIREARLSTDERRQLVEAQADLESLPIYIDDTPRRTIADIAAQARRLQRQGGLGLLAIDYLSLLEPENPRDPRQEQVAKMARRLKTLARELGVPVVCLAQLNRENEKATDHRPRLGHLRESGAIEQDADVVLFVHREEVYRPNDPDLKGKAEIIIGKNRNGGTGVVPVVWRGKTTQFVTAARGEEWSY